MEEQNTVLLWTESLKLSFISCLSATDPVLSLSLTRLPSLPSCPNYLENTLRSLETATLMTSIGQYYAGCDPEPCLLSEGCKQSVSGLSSLALSNLDLFFFCPSHHSSWASEVILIQQRSMERANISVAARQVAALQWQQNSQLSPPTRPQRSKDSFMEIWKATE